MFLAELSQKNLAYFGLLLFLAFVGLIVSLIYSSWLAQKSSCPSPYTGKPLRKGGDIHWMTVEKVLRFLYNMHDYHNQMFDLGNSALCRETGRLFPKAVSWYGSIKVDWSFIQKRYPGNFVSWGSLSEEQKIRIVDKHESLEGFQSEYSSPTPSPMKVEPQYAHAKPGPLYVDLATGVLIGWKCVPETDLEVLIVQQPREVYIPKI